MNEVYESLTAAVDTGYFEELIREYLLENPHAAFITGVPEIGRDVREEEEVKKELGEKREKLSEADRKTIIQDTEHLKQYLI